MPEVSTKIIDQPQEVVKKPVPPAELMRRYCSSESIQTKLGSMLGESKNTFLASLLDLYTGDGNLMACDPVAVIQEAMKAAALKLPIAKSLGFAYNVPFKDKNGNPIPTFIMGYRGYIQLAMRTGQYKAINADAVYEGEKVNFNRVTGILEITGAPTSDKAIGYFAYIEMLNGFYKAIYWPREKVEAHAKAKSRSWKMSSSPWHTDFDSMACKTLLRQILSKYGFMSIEYMTAIANDNDERVEQEVMQNANATPIIIDDPAAVVPAIEDGTVDQETGEIINSDAVDAAVGAAVDEMIGMSPEPDF